MNRTAQAYGLDAVAEAADAVLDRVCELSIRRANPLLDVWAVKLVGSHENLIFEFVGLHGDPGQAADACIVELASWRAARGVERPVRAIAIGDEFFIGTMPYSLATIYSDGSVWAYEGVDAGYGDGGRYFKPEKLLEHGYVAVLA